MKKSKNDVLAMLAAIQNTLGEVRVCGESNLEYLFNSMRALKEVQSALSGAEIIFPKENPEPPKP